MQDAARGRGKTSADKAISIVGARSIAGVLASANGNAITFSAGSSDKIILRGLTIEGGGIAYNGIVFNSGGVLEVADCVIQNFVNGGSPGGNGIMLQPASGSPTFIVTNTSVSHNGNTGLSYSPLSGTPAASLVIDRLTATDNSNGIDMEPGPASQATTVATITNSILSKNRQYGFLLEGQKTKVDIDLCHADENVSIGYAVGFASVTIGRSVGANNGQIGLNNGGGTVMSYKDNRFAGNGLNQTNGTIGTATLN